MANLYPNHTMVKYEVTPGRWAFGQTWTRHMHESRLKVLWLTKGNLPSEVSSFKLETGKARDNG